MSKKAKCIGEMDLSEANEMNVPINIFIHDQGDSDSGDWELTAYNYMPRKNYAAESMYHYTADSKEALLALVKKYIVPLYKTALKQLETNGELYYWEEK